MKGLDAAVEQLCLEAQRVPPAERVDVMRELEELARSLDALAAEIARQSEAAQRQRANDAYGEGT